MYPDDIVQFVHKYFDRTMIVTVYQAFAAAGITSPQGMRAVLLLSAGSMSQLKHYVNAAKEDLSEVIYWAEYDDTVGEEPMRMHDLKKPLDALETI